jgi:hypothetical protein
MWCINNSIIKLTTMSSVVLLRKLTNKSVINFGKYFDLTVQQCLDTKKRKYLRWVYFNCSNITFTDELLDELLIPVDYRFDKPNKNVELGIKLEENLKENYPEWFKKKLEKKANRIRKSEAIKVDFKSDRVKSKLSLMNENRRTKSKYN